MKILLALIALSFAALTQAGEIDAKVEAALAAESRPEADVIRDRNRKPLETLKFFGLQDDMRVLELLPGGGWYTRVLAPVLADNGKLYVGLSTKRVKEKVLTEPGFEKVEVLETNENTRRPEGARLYTMDDPLARVQAVLATLFMRDRHEDRVILPFWHEPEHSKV